MPSKSRALLIQVEQRIVLIRSQKVMLSHDLAELYGVQAGALNRAVKRNSTRFPQDFMFQLSKKEWDALRCQFGISSLPGKGSQNVTPSWGGNRLPPFAFTVSHARLKEKAAEVPRLRDAQAAFLNS
jgi:ORF6N domain